MSDSADVVVIGGGIVGCACAYELSNRGAQVMMLEYGKTGMQATNAAAGMLAPLTETHEPGAMLEFGVRALREYPRLVAELEAACSFGLELRLSGILKVAFDAEQTATLRRRFAWQRELGFTLEWADEELCREIEPRLGPLAIAGVFSPSEGSVSNQAVTLALERAATMLGAEVRQRAGARSFERRGERVTGVRAADGTTYRADNVVIAAGARSGQLAARLGVALPVRPMRGQMIALGGMRAPIRHIVWGPDGYLVPRANGLVFAGATVEDVGFRRRTTAAGIRRLGAMAAALVPQLGAATEHFSWAGLRPGSADGMPMIGRIPGWENVFAATGHFRNGILLGPLTGRLVAEALVAGDWSCIPAEFDPARFLAPAPARPRARAAT